MDEKIIEPILVGWLNKLFTEGEPDWIWVLLLL